MGLTPANVNMRSLTASGSVVWVRGLWSGLVPPPILVNVEIQTNSAMCGGLNFQPERAVVRLLKA